MLRKARRGDPAAFVALLEPAHDRLASLIYRVTGDGSAVSDVLQDVYLAAYRSLPGCCTPD